MNVDTYKFETTLPRADGSEFTVENTVIAGKHGESLVVAKTDPENQRVLNESVLKNKADINEQVAKLSGTELDPKQMRYVESLPEGSFNQRNLEHGAGSPSDNQRVSREELANHIEHMEAGREISQTASKDQQADLDLSKESFTHSI